jgi:hypothetical protein
MLNHIWTLLLNEDVTASIRGRLGELPQTPGYKKVVLSSGLNSIRRCLYGTNPDIEMLHYRTRQFIKCLLSGRLEPYAYAFDSRHTYNEESTDFFSSSIYRPVPKLISGASNLVMNIHASAAPPDSSGIIRHSYSLTTSGSILYVTGLAGFSQTITSLAANEQRELGKSGYYFSLSDPTQPQIWLVEFINKPVASLGTLMANVAVSGEPAINELFGITDTEPYITFKKIFFESQDLPLKCAAVALALAYQTENKRVIS